MRRAALRARQLLADLLSSWTDSDRTAFADLLKSFNGRLDERFGSD